MAAQGGMEEDALCDGWVVRRLGCLHSVLLAQLQPGAGRAGSQGTRCTGLGGISVPQTARGLHKKWAN